MFRLVNRRKNPPSFSFSPLHSMIVYRRVSPLFFFFVRCAAHNRTCIHASLLLSLLFFLSLYTKTGTAREDPPSQSLSISVVKRFTGSSFSFSFFPLFAAGRRGKSDLWTPLFLTNESENGLNSPPFLLLCAMRRSRAFFFLQRNPIGNEKLFPNFSNSM